jgi:hypothetical protein
VKGDVPPMENAKEKFTIDITDRGLEITTTETGKKKTLRFTAGEALMLLDILEHEAEGLREMAERASPVSMKFTS